MDSQLCVLHTCLDCECGGMNESCIQNSNAVCTMHSEDGIPTNEPNTPAQHLTTRHRYWGDKHTQRCKPDCTIAFL